MSTYVLDGHSLTIKEIAAMLEDEHPHVEIAPEARELCMRSRAQVEKWLESGAPAVYGINTGLGALKDVMVPPEKHIEWNKTLPYVHGAGFGDYLPAEVTRVELLLRANILCRSYSAVRVELIERLLDLFCAGVSPAVYGDGSTGLSDLAPIAQNIMTVAGLEGAKSISNGTVRPSAEVLREKQLPETFELECKEVLAQMNGSTMTQAIAVIAFIRFEKLFQTYVKQMCNIISRDRLTAYEETVEFIREILNLENNITCDNPNLFELPDGSFEAVMGCNCSNTQVGYCMDLLSVIVADMANDLAGEHSQLRTLVDRLRLMCMQVSADSIPTKGGQEDHVEFSYSAARKADLGIELFSHILECTAKETYGG